MSKTPPSQSAPGYPCAAVRRLSRSEKIGGRLYDLRHTCATLLNSNVHPKYVQEPLGHASIAQRLDTYNQVLKGMDNGIGDAVDAAVG
jgi:integrase